MSAAAGASGDSQVASKLGLTPGQVVQEIGWDDDVDDDLRVAIEGEPRTAKWAREDSDFDGLRDDEEFVKLVS